MNSDRRFHELQKGLLLFHIIKRGKGVRTLFSEPKTCSDLCDSPFQQLRVSALVMREGQELFSRSSKEFREVLFTGLEESKARSVRLSRL